MTSPTFQSHNIRLDNGEYTMDDAPGFLIANDFRLLCAKRILELVFEGDIAILDKILHRIGWADKYRKFSIADLGCQEGGYTVEFARMGFHSVGIEVREINYNACNYVLQNVNLPNLNFYKDSIWNLENYGQFDAIFCQGLLYHLDRPKYFLEYIAPLTRKVLILQTHFAPYFDEMETNSIYGLSSLHENEGLMGRWQTEYESGAQLSDIEALLTSSYENEKSFWPQREYLLQILKEVGFDMVFECFDWLGSNIASKMLDTDGYYRKHHRGLFVGIKTNPGAR